MSTLETEFGASYLTLYGEFLHISTSSRPDITHAMSRLVNFQPDPSRLGFDSLYRVYKYLQKYPSIPLFYPKLSHDRKTRFTSHRNPNNTLTMPHTLCGFSDNASGPAQSIHQIDGCCKLIGSVVIDWKTSKNFSCGTSMTDNEIRALFREAKRCRKTRLFLQQIGILLPSGTPIFNHIKHEILAPMILIEDNKGACDCINAYKVTTNLRHI